MRLDDFDFTLPESAIALRPASPRDSARLLVVRPGGEPLLEDRIVRALPELLSPGDVLVMNDTRVIPARLRGVRTARDPASADVEIEALLVHRLDAQRWQAMVRPGKRLKAGDRVTFGARASVCLLGELNALVEDKADDGTVTFAFDRTGAYLDEAVATIGEMPLPPYIAAQRATDESDLADYQTVYARREGAIAAPTAGLHFTDTLLERLRAREISTEFVTLHVGAGTFLPVKTDDLTHHRIHAEWGEIDEATGARLAAAKREGRRIVAVGTTSIRLIEAAAAANGLGAPFQGETDIFIKPGFPFRAVDVLMTNFHLPKSTLFVLISAFSGLDVIKQAYAHAVSSGYRFYSYGDACLLHRARP
jgi:S-adenosylmethionine:tRNA ribosyltransferase-isomerase